MKSAYIQLALAMCLVGMNITIGKIIVQTVPIFLFSNIRFLISLLFLIPMTMMKGQSKFDLKPKEWIILFLQAFFGLFLYSIFMLYGVSHTSAISAGIITSTTPACIALIAFFFLKEKLSRTALISVLLAVLGISLITFRQDGTGFSGSALGNVFVVVAVISEALFTIFAKPLSDKLQPIQMASAVNLIGFIIFIPFSIQQILSVNVRIEPGTWLLIIYYALTASVISFILWYRGVAKVPANVAGLFTVFMPVSAAITSIVFLKESFAISQAIGMGLAVIAILTGIRRPQRKSC